MTDARHWDAAYEKGEGAVGWFQAEAAASLQMIAAAGLRPGDPVIDVGGGASRLVDGLLDRGLGPVTVLDLSRAGLELARDRLGARADQVRWIEADVTAWQPRDSWTLWHDRAVFHFLTDVAEQDAYARALHRALVPGGAAVIATFAPDGPDRCSGLPIRRWSSEALAEALRLSLLRADRQTHVTPKGVEQRFQIALMRKVIETWEDGDE